jgi:hypothetical protein
VAATVYIHTNDKQYLGALVAQHSMRRNSLHADRFDVQILHTREYDFLRRRHGQKYLRRGGAQLWRSDDLQSFTPLRFMPPELMGYAGRAVVVDPDVFAVGDVWQLLTRDMGGAAIMARLHWSAKDQSGPFASSVMLLDCAKLPHWRCEEQFEELFAFKRDYQAWMNLELEPEGSIGVLEPEWNDFDRLAPETKLLHNTKQETQPWKTGLPVDFLRPDKPEGLRKLPLVDRLRRTMFGEYAFLGTYERHPDPAQERFFFGLLRECIEQGLVSEALLTAAVRANQVRHDIREVIERTPPLGCLGSPGT